jgi:hypothetical protein
MSFSYSVKEELIEANLSGQKLKPLLLGILMFSKKFSPEQILLQTENERVADCFCSLVGQSAGNPSAVLKRIKARKNRRPLYSLSVENEETIKAIYNFLEIDFTNKDVGFRTELIGKKKNFVAFTAGAFLACGSVSDPLKEYHLEFVVPEMTLCNALGEIFLSIGILAKQTERKKTYVVYLKESENIEDVLTFMGAPKSSLEIMNVKILKNVRNKINRSVNCDSANIEKTIRASEKQIEAIELIEKNGAIASLPDDLIEIAELRRENPDWSLKELGKNLSSPISRSGANHRINRILKIAFKD